jgi:hypothetical protein
MRTQRSERAAELAFDPAVLLLKMLRPQEHAFLPRDAVGPGHCDLLGGRAGPLRGRARFMCARSMCIRLVNGARIVYSLCCADSSLIARS